MGFDSSLFKKKKEKNVTGLTFGKIQNMSPTFRKSAQSRKQWRIQRPLCRGVKGRILPILTENGPKYTCFWKILGQCRGGGRPLRPPLNPPLPLCEATWPLCAGENREKEVFLLSIHFSTNFYRLRGEIDVLIQHCIYVSSRYSSI